MREIKKQQVGDYVERAMSDIQLLAGSEDVHHINKQLNLYGAEQTIKASEPFAIDSAEYQDLWQQHGSNLLNYVKVYGYSDIYIISNTAGHVIYTANKLTDLGQNLSVDKNVNNPLRLIWQQVMKTGRVTFQDFRPYSINNNQPAAFLGAPVTNADGSIQAVVVIQISLPAINQIMRQRNGMGTSGETYLVGPDYLMRSDSLLEPQKRSVIASFANPQTASVKTEASIAALQQQTDTKLIHDYTGTEVLTAYTWVQVGDVVWALIAEINAEEAFAAVNRLSQLVWLIFGCSTLVIILIASTVTRAVTQPVMRLSNALKKVASEGNYAVRLDVTSQDEIGQCAKDFNLLIATSETAVSEISQVMAKLAQGDFNHRIEADFKGDLLLIKQATNKSLDNIQHNEKERRLMAAEAKIVSEENARVRQALDNVSTNTIITDNEYKIIYVNRAAAKVIKEAAAGFQNPNFNPNVIIGCSMDIFHQDPQHQRRVLNGLSGNHYFEFAMSNKYFGLNVNPIIDDEGDRLGIVGELTDRTAEIAIEKEIGGVMEAAAKGDFSRRLTLESKQGFFLNLSNGLNQLTMTVEDALADIQRILAAMAGGDLSVRVTQDYQGRLKNLKDDANRTIDKLTQVIKQIRTSAQTISYSTNEIATGNRDLSRRTEAQARSLKSTAASMGKITTTVKFSADNAMVANSFSLEASTKAQSGGEVVTRSITAMNSITEASDKIADIISVIDEITFQTNLLALNAAVEAARAGEQGRGFAVVAGEVRNLAQRSASAAKEIKLLIRNSNDKVVTGAQLVGETGSTLQEIVETVSLVQESMNEISVGAQQQSLDIEQVNNAIAKMDEMTQQNAGLVAQAAIASETLLTQAEDMTKLLEFFLLNNQKMRG